MFKRAEFTDMQIIETLFHVLNQIDEIFWGYIGFSVVFLLGGFMTWRARFYQMHVLASPLQVISNLHEETKKNDQGINPFKLFFASVGGMIGLGNVVAVLTSLLVGGPGALLWLWLASLIGMIIKYSEIYLGVTFREDRHETFIGGPIYYLQKAFKNPILQKVMPAAVAILLCIYGIEIYQFVVIVDTFTNYFHTPRVTVIAGLLVCTLFTCLGGVKRLSTISSTLMPFFMVSYCGMTMTYILCHYDLVPHAFTLIITSAFTGHAAVGGFAGAGIFVAIQQGVARAVYSGDIGIGYDSIIQSETKSQKPQNQAQLAILGMLLDTIICTLTIFVVLLSGVWKTDIHLLPSQYIPHVLSEIFPYMDSFMTIFIFLAGWTTINSYFVVGIQCAKFLFPKNGKYLYIAYAICAFVFFSYYDQTKVLLIMSLCGGMLMTINLIGIIKLRKHIQFLR